MEILHNYEIIVCPVSACCSELNKCRFTVVISTREEIDSRQNSLIVLVFECAHCNDILSLLFDHVVFPCHPLLSVLCSSVYIIVAYLSL